MHLSPEEISRRLRAGRPVPDRAFDAWLPAIERSVSYRYWTSVQVAAQAARWLAAERVSRVLDVGSGAGKFCVAGALATDLSFVGLEHRPHLLSIAEEVAERFGVSDRVKFVLGEFGVAALPTCDALYFYNPFGEQPFPRCNHLDKTVEIGRQRFTRDVAAAEQVLSELAVGKHVVTYNSFGGRMPDTFDLVRAKAAGVDQLRLWRKARVHGLGGFWLELEGPTVLRGTGESEVVLCVLPQAKEAAE